jgi:putative membrane protein
MDIPDKSTELSARRTGMSFQRTRMSADRTLMSFMRTSLSLISFGFTIHKFFQQLQEQRPLPLARSSRTFGEALIWLGIGTMALGILYHVMFMRGLRRERESMRREGLIHAESAFPPSGALVIAVLLLLLGVVAIVSIALRRGPLA